MTDEKKSRGRTAADILAAGTGGLLGATGVYYAKEKLLSPANRLIDNIIEMVRNGQQGIKGQRGHAIREIMNQTDINIKEAGLVADAMENPKHCSEDALRAYHKFARNVMDQELKGVAKTLSKHPNKFMAGGIAAGGTLAMGAAAALRGGKGQPQSFVEREEERRMDTAAELPEFTR